jgi:hypothetical protein
MISSVNQDPNSKEMDYVQMYQNISTKDKSLQNKLNSNKISENTKRAMSKVYEINLFPMTTKSDGKILKNNNILNQSTNSIKSNTSKANNYNFNTSNSKEKTKHGVSNSLFESLANTSINSITFNKPSNSKPSYSNSDRKR